jgi:hypothetical protein
MVLFGDKCAKNGDLQLVENFVGNVMGTLGEIAKYLYYCFMFYGLRPISPLCSLSYPHSPMALGNSLP